MEGRWREGGRGGGGREGGRDGKQENGGRECIEGGKEMTERHVYFIYLHV